MKIIYNNNFKNWRIFLGILCFICIIESIILIAFWKYTLGGDNILITSYKNGVMYLIEESYICDLIGVNKKIYQCFNNIITSILIQTIIISLLSTFVFFSKNKWAICFFIAIPLSLWIKLKTLEPNIYLQTKDNCMDIDCFILSVIKLGDDMLFSVFILGFFSIVAMIILIKEFIYKKKNQ